MMGYLWTGNEWIWNPAHGPEGGPSRYPKKPVQTEATAEEMQAYRREQMRPADRNVIRLFDEIRRGRRVKRWQYRERNAWRELAEYLAGADRHV